MAAAMLVALSFTAGAEETASLEPRPEQSRAEFERVSREITLSEERKADLAAEIAEVRKDSATITAALIQSAKTERKLGQDIEDISDRVEALKGQEAGIKQSLAARRGVLAEVLGALQRMGLNPPPAVLVKPEDALASVRSAILLGAVVPELRKETEALVADLAELARITATIEAERTRLTAAFSEQLAEKQRLNLLVDEKRRLQGEQEEALVAEQKRSEALANKAKSLKGSDRCAGEAGGGGREGADSQSRAGAPRGRACRAAGSGGQPAGCGCAFRVAETPDRAAGDRENHAPIRRRRR